MKFQDNKHLKNTQPPSYLAEVTFASTLLLVAKFYSLNCFALITFVAILSPFMAYFVCCMFGGILAFITALNIDSDDSLLSSLQTGHLVQILQSMLFYFALYSLSGELDTLLDLHKPKGPMFDSIMVPALALESALLISLVNNYRLRKQIAAAKGETSALGFLGATGLTTIFNALTQTTTTLCAGGQCFTVGSNAISSNLAAFGVSVTGINVYLIPLCLCLLCYSIWNVFKTKRDPLYVPFLCSVLGASMIVLDNFVLGEQYHLHNIPSWIGNALLIGAALWSGRDSVKDNAPPFGF